MKAYATKMAKSQDIDRKWYVVDATDKVLGRLAAEVANVLRGKNKPCFTPNADCGDFVIIVNADKIRLTGNKLDQKLYKTYSGHPGGLKEIAYRHFLEEKPAQLVYKAVRGMVPHNKLGDQVMKKLRVYAGPDHPHAAQQPEEMAL
ncbi:50S ribosomal protein L13 [uncultured Pseudoramibacter sp.]|jgi:large subunit ribosomal protein L13|uniref:Large ribosomal subunit protein uL13 n=1 Tax=Candidatus Pseudoramibacter fermentans TaxID=2594427 RepID=A0A6L5GSI9_9FIRM|nr:50S ribosomal protein L13 [uncultured Pseudoramibacter sp.]MQM73215.1 50S ribosomal protein L13 [Candidatus Pseudoramibacter fermentans]RRF93128.1 MAG: 50S ribosomal protein L13 [Eubacteriaceae bacterium]